MRLASDDRETDATSRVDFDFFAPRTGFACIFVALLALRVVMIIILRKIKYAHVSYRAINRAHARSLRTRAGALNLRGGSRAHFYLKVGAARNNREFRKGHAQVAYISDYRSVSLLLSHDKFAPANCNEQRALSARSLAPGCRLMSTRDKESIVHQS